MLRHGVDLLKTSSNTNVHRWLKIVYNLSDNPEYFGHKIAATIPHLEWLNQIVLRDGAHIEYIIMEKILTSMKEFALIQTTIKEDEIGKMCEEAHPFLRIR